MFDKPVALKDNKPQQLQMDRVIEGSFNGFDGPMVAKSLADNADLWDGFVFGRFGYFTLIELRDISQGYLNADTLMILTTKGNKNSRLKKLLEVIETWRADEVGYNYYTPARKFVVKGTAPFNQEKDAFTELGSSLGDDQVLIRVWWD